MIKIEDFIPHRQLINHALRKASNDLKVQISSYQARYEQKVAECKKEVAIEIERKKQHFEKIKQSYVDQLTSESVALEGVKELFFKYVDVYRERQVLMYHKEKIGQEIALRKEHYDFLGEQKRLIEADIEILTDRKDILSKQSSVDDIIALIQLSSSTIECTSDDNAKSLLDKVNDVLYLQINLTSFTTNIDQSSEEDVITLRLDIVDTQSNTTIEVTEPIIFSCN